MSRLVINVDSLNYTGTYACHAHNSVGVKEVSQGVNGLTHEEYGSIKRDQRQLKGGDRYNPISRRNRLQLSETRQSVSYKSCKMDIRASTRLIERSFQASAKIEIDEGSTGQIPTKNQRKVAVLTCFEKGHSINRGVSWEYHGQALGQLVGVHQMNNGTLVLLDVDPLSPELKHYTCKARNRRRQNTVDLVSEPFMLEKPIFRWKSRTRRLSLRRSRM